MERKEIFTVVLIGLLVLTTALQTVQIAGLSSAQVLAPTGQAPQSLTSVQATPSKTSATTSLQDLPSMVGGC